MSVLVDYDVAVIGADPGNPEDPAVQQLVLDAFKARILGPQSNTQEMLAYLERMAEARQRQLADD